jgi:putative spermidine/putrescine transport system permease protein
VPAVLIGVSAVPVSFDEDLERAARGLGAGRIATFRHVTCPLIQPAILSGMLFAFLMSFGERTVALFLTGTTSQTLPVRMWTAMLDELTPAIAAISILLIPLSVFVILGAQLAQWLAERRLRRED